MKSTVLAAVLACLVTLPANAASECAAYFEAVGRTFVPDAPGVKIEPGRSGGFLDCPDDQLMQFAFDVAAADRAQPVTSREQMLGTWVSDDVLGVVTGLFVPVYEVLEITPGDADGEVRVMQKLYRSRDPASMFADEMNPVPPIDVTAAGRIATYGRHVAVLAKPGELEPRHVRYFDFPVEFDRLTGLAMKTRFLAVLQLAPLGIATDGERLVVTVFDRMARGDRVMTFRRRHPDSPERALKMAMVGHLPLAGFHCFIEAMERPTPAFTAMLGRHDEEDFFATIDEADRLSGEYEALQRRLRPDTPEATRAEIEAELKKIGLRLIDLSESGPVAALRAEAERAAPFGCPGVH